MLPSSPWGNNPAGLYNHPMFHPPVTAWLIAACLGAAVLAAGCPTKPKPADTTGTGFPAVEPGPPEVTLITDEEYPQDWGGVIDMPGTDDPALSLLAQRVLYPSGIDRHCDELPYRAWEVFAERLEERIAEDESAFACWLMAQVQLRLWWCGPTDDPVYIAADYAGRALELAPDSACALAAAALTESCLDNPDAAYEQINAAVALRPDLVFPWVIQGLIHRHNKDYTAAIESYDRALDLNIRALVVNLYRGHAYWDLGEYEQALAAYEILAAQAPDYALGQLNCAWVYYKLDRKDEAFSAVSRAVECHDQISEAHRLLGTIYYERSEYEEARRALDWALTLDPDNDNAHYYMGHYYYSSSLMGKAVDAYLRANELSPDEPETYCSLGQAYQLMGDFENATAALEKAIELSDPGYWAYDEAVASLAEIAAATVEPE